ncbi:tyrosine recombinase XerC [Promicromonospora sp. NPDC059942]|uniref:site-specific integrase n=1 Tax=Promicromonospora sp. NPDC059942 TaxID=3347009 RepID=UPI00364894D9
MTRRLEPGERGEISYTGTTGNVRAFQYFRDHGDVRRRGSGVGHTKKAAREAVTKNIDAALRTDDMFGPNARLEDAVRVWLRSFRTMAENGRRKRSTYDQYERYARVEVFPYIGQLRFTELTTGRLDVFLNGLYERKGFATAKVVRSVLSGTCRMLARRDLLPSNPVRDVGRLEQGRRKAPRALTAEEALRFLALLDGSEYARRNELSDIMRFLLSTGARIGEALALKWEDVDLDDQVVQIDWTVTRLRGAGLVREPVKTETSERTLRLPDWSVAMLRRRKNGGPDDLVFPNTLGRLRDVGNVGKMLRKVRGDDFAWVKSHTARRTVATLLDGQGLTARAIADQLGHARPSMTQDVYMGRRIVGEAKSPLDGMFAQPEGVDGDGDAA